MNNAWEHPGNKYEIVAEGDCLNGELYLINCSFDKEKVYSSGGYLYVGWYLNVRVVNPQGLILRDSVNITVLDKNSTEVFNGNTDALGYRRYIICLEYYYNTHNTIIYYTSHKVIARYSAFEGSVDVYMNETKNVEIFLRYNSAKTASSLDEIMNKLYSLFVSIAIVFCTFITAFPQLSDGEIGWSMPRGNLGRTGVSNSTAPEVNSILWHFRAEGVKEPAIANGKVFITFYRTGSDRVQMSFIYALNESNGEYIWGAHGRQLL